jgi:shikimate dehydrogenase
MILSAKARIAGVMGWPVGHSRSPRVHGYWLEQLGIDGAYVPLPVRPEDFADALRALPKLGFCGCNVTVPHKQAALALCERVDADARRIGAVNTVVVGEDGALDGRNTDAFGFSENILRNAPGWSFAKGPAVVLGAGGAARAVLAALADAGAPEIRLINRTRGRAEDLAADIGGSAEVRAWGDWSALEGAHLLVNTTSLGMTGQPPLEIDLSALPNAALVNDIVYAPLETGLLTAARARGNPVVDGLGMLLYQAVPGFAAWYGATPEVTDALRRFVLRD